MNVQVIDARGSSVRSLTTSNATIRQAARELNLDTTNNILNVNSKNVVDTVTDPDNELSWDTTVRADDMFVLVPSKVTGNA